MPIEKVNLQEKFELFKDHWNPRIVGELNGQAVKIAKIKGEFVWHHHENEDELFLVIDGTLLMDFRDQTITLKKGEMIIVPRGVEHRPRTNGEEVQILLFEPLSTLNTGEDRNEFTKENLEHI